MRLILRRYSTGVGVGGLLNTAGTKTGAVSQVQAFTSGIRADGGVSVGIAPINALTLWTSTVDNNFGATIYNENLTGTAARAAVSFNNGAVNASISLNGVGMPAGGYYNPSGLTAINAGSGGIDFAATHETGRIGFWTVSSLAMVIAATGYVGVQEISPTAVLHIAASTATRAQMRLAAGTVPTAPNDGDIARGSTGFTLYNIDSGTNAVINHVIANRQSSGTPADGFGVGFAALLESSTTVDQNAGQLTFAWSTATHATRASKGQLSAYYTSTERPTITWGANSTVSLLSFHDVTTPIARPVLATGAGRTADDIITVLQNYGLVKQS